LTNGPWSNKPLKQIPFQKLTLETTFLKSNMNSSRTKGTMKKTRITKMKSKRKNNPTALSMETVGAARIRTEEAGVTIKMTVVVEMTLSVKAGLKEVSTQTKMKMMETTNKPRVTEATKEVVVDNADLGAAEEVVEATMLKLPTSLLKVIRKNKREKFSHQETPLPRTTTTPAETNPPSPSPPPPPLNLLSKKWKANQMLKTVCE